MEADIFQSGSLDSRDSRESFIHHNSLDRIRQIFGRFVNLWISIVYEIKCIGSAFDEA
jgi:hypothetical protein